MNKMLKTVVTANGEALQLVSQVNLQIEVGALLKHHLVLRFPKSEYLC